MNEDADDDGGQRKCQSAIPQIQGLGYNLTVILLPTQEVNLKIPRELHQIHEALKDDFSKIVSEMDLSFSYYVSNQKFVMKPEPERSFENRTPSNQVIGDGKGGGQESNEDWKEKPDRLLKIEISGHLLALANMSRDEFEAKISNLTTNIANVDQPYGGVPLRCSHLGYYVREIEGGTHMYGRVETDFESCTTDGPFFDDQQSYIQMNLGYNVYEKRAHSQCKNTALWKALHLFIDVSPSLTCPFVSFNLTKDPVFVEKDSTVVFAFRIRDQDVNVTSRDAVSYSTSDHLIHICLAFLHNITDNVSVRYVYYRLFDDNTITRVEYYVEIVCMCISIVFLFVSVLTYCIFPSLRTLPGLNNMCLCISLLTAQLSLLVTSMFGLRGYFSRVYCTIHAIIFHYSWLASFVWMGVCCAHMYRVFTSTGSHISDARSDRKRHRRHCLIGFGVPALIVAMTAAITLATTNGDSSGYNSENCFMDTKTSILVIVLGLLVPFATTTLCNVVLFILTVKEIVTVSRMAQSVGTRKSHGVIAYVKLSTLTGAFCVLAAIAVQFKSPLAALFASPFAALQGFFIFLSFLVNAHVKSLYQSLLCPDRKEKKPTTSFNSSQTNQKSSANTTLTTTTTAFDKN